MVDRVGGQERSIDTIVLDFFPALKKAEILDEDLKYSLVLLFEHLLDPANKPYPSDDCLRRTYADPVDVHGAALFRAIYERGEKQQWTGKIVDEDTLKIGLRRIQAAAAVERSVAPAAPAETGKSKKAPKKPTAGEIPESGEGKKANRLRSIQEAASRLWNKEISVTSRKKSAETSTPPDAPPLPAAATEPVSAHTEETREDIAAAFDLHGPEVIFFDSSAEFAAASIPDIIPRTERVPLTDTLRPRLASPTIPPTERVAAPPVRRDTEAPHDEVEFPDGVSHLPPAAPAPPSTTVGPALSDSSEEATEPDARWKPPEPAGPASSPEGREYSEQEICDTIRDFLCYNDVFKRDETWCETNAYHNKSCRRYAKELLFLMHDHESTREGGGDKYVVVARAIRKKFNDYIDLLPSAPREGVASVNRSITWTYWDMAKQHYYFRHPDETDRYRYFVGDPLTYPIIQSEIVERHIGWNVWENFKSSWYFSDDVVDTDADVISNIRNFLHQYVSDAPCFLDCDQAVTELLPILIECHQSAMDPERVKRLNFSEPSSYLLQELGRAVTRFIDQYLGSLI